MTDVIIIGGGPAGATAAVYTARANLKTTLIYKNYGALETAELVANYYGFSKISGKQLIEKGLRQARKCGAKTICDEVTGIRKNKNIIIIETPNKFYESKAVLLATGASRTMPSIPGLTELEGRGVSHCAICDGFFYREKNVAILGNSAYALHEAQDLISLASHITILTNGKEPAITFPDTVTVRKEAVKEIISGKPENKMMIPGMTKVLQGVMLDSGEKIPLDGLFIAVGIAGGTELARKIGAAVDPQGQITVGNEMQTSVQGLWAAGDCTGGLKQIVKAAHDGAAAGLSMIKHLRD